MELHNVILDLRPEWAEKAETLAARLEHAGIRCIRQGNAGRLWSAAEMPENGACEAADTPVLPAGCETADTLVLTDDRGTAAALAGRGIVCVGCAADEGFFDGAALVTDDPETLDAELLEECLLRAQGRPVTVAVTERLVIREIAKQDFADLYRISRQRGMRSLFPDPEINCFEPERLAAYIRYAYRLCGYGLWSVLLRDGTLIGCCGLADLADAPPARLELQYMLAEEFQGQGYALEMCRAALRFASERTDRQEIWLRIRPDNAASLRLARRLGFTLRGTEADGMFSRKL